MEPDTFTKFIQLRSTFSLHHHQMMRIIIPQRDSCFGQHHHSSPITATLVRTSHPLSWSTALGSSHRSMLQVALGICSTNSACRAALRTFSALVKETSCFYTHTRNHKSKSTKGDTLGGECTRNAHGSRITHVAEYTRKSLYIEWATYE